MQRVMKYPLFFKSLSECLLQSDGEYKEIQGFLVELDVTLRYFEKQKKESEDFLKLEDLACRIKGLEGSTIRLAEHHRKLIYEGYLYLVPVSDPSYPSVRLEDSSGSFASSVYRPSLTRKSSTFSLASKKMKRAYVFLFNDMIVCTSVSVYSYKIYIITTKKKLPFFFNYYRKEIKRDQVQLKIKQWAHRLVKELITDPLPTHFLKSHIHQVKSHLLIEQ
ncbi:MAG: hypothetical protein JSY10_08280 [Paenibacillus sp.]|nr:hypothetical protein [Paenibacillus sp.]